MKNKFKYVLYRIFYKIWDFLRYDIIRFFRNIWLFRKELYHYQKWDWRHQMMMLRRGLELESDYIKKHGLEVDESRLKKVEKINRVIEIIKWHEDDLFLELAEKELGYKYPIRDFEFKEADSSKLDINITKGQKYYELIDNNTEDEKIKIKTISELSNKIQKESFDELLEIFKGQDYKKFDITIDWHEQFDGSGLQNWSD